METQSIQVSVEKDLSTAVIGGVKVEVTPDSNVVIYTNEGVQTKPAAEAPAREGVPVLKISPASGTGREGAHPEGLSRKSGYLKGFVSPRETGGTHISVSADFNTVVLNGAKLERSANGLLVISTPGMVITKPAIETLTPLAGVEAKLAGVAAGGPANDSGCKDIPRSPSAPTASWATLQAGDPGPAGDAAHAGLTYAGIPPGEDKALWVQLAPRLMNHFDAATWARQQGGRLPNRAQGDYLDTIKDKGAFKDLFNRSGSFPAGYVWLAEPDTNDRSRAWCQRLSGGEQYNFLNRKVELPVLCVVRLRSCTRD